MVALRCVRPDRPALPAVALRGSGSGLPAEESPQEESHRVMKAAAAAGGDVQPSEGSAGGQGHQGQPQAGLSPDGCLSSSSLTVVASRRRERLKRLPCAGMWARSISLHQNQSSQKEQQHPNHQDAVTTGLKY